MRNQVHNEIMFAVNVRNTFIRSLVIPILFCMSNIIIITQPPHAMFNQRGVTKHYNYSTLILLFGDVRESIVIVIIIKNKPA